MNNQDIKIKLNSRNGSLAFALFVSVYVVVSLLGQLLVGAIFGADTTAYKAICSTFSSLSMLGVILFWVFYGKNNFFAITSTKNSGGIYLLVAILLSAGMFLGLGFVNQSVATIIESLGLKVSAITLAMPTAWHFIAYVITFAIMPAIIEEIFFRGIILNSFSKMNRALAVIFSALLFALYHQSLTQFLYQFIFGIALGFLALTAKSVFPCIISHFINNFIVLLFNFIKFELDLFDPIILVVGANALAFFGAIIFFAFRKMEKPQIVKGEVKGFLLPFGILGMLICLATMIGVLVA